MKTLPEQPTELKPCPFCGGIGEFNLHDRSKLYVVDCMRCGCTMMYGKTEEDCAKAWNTRADAAPDTSAEAVGVTGEMPGSNGGFSMAVFRAIDVPVGTKLYTNSAPSLDGLDVDALAQEIRRVDGNHKLGAAALAEALMPFLKSWLGVG